MIVLVCDDAVRRLIFVDIGNSEHPHLTPPESLGDQLMLKPYQEGTARVFLNPWTCQDYAWWKAQVCRVV